MRYVLQYTNWCSVVSLFFFFKQKTAYEMRISDWSSDVCSSDHPRVLTLVKHAGEKGMVVVMDNASIVPSDNEKLFNLALAAPKTKFIFGHMGGLGFRFWNILALARTAENLFADNIYFDLSASEILAADSPIEEEYVRTIRHVGADLVLIASGRTGERRGGKAC